MAKTFKEAQKVRMQKSRLKITLTAFSNNKNIIHREFVPEKTECKRYNL
jgi:hypothetical protein